MRCCGSYRENWREQMAYSKICLRVPESARPPIRGWLNPTDHLKKPSAGRFHQQSHYLVCRSHENSCRMVAREALSTGLQPPYAVKSTSLSDSSSVRSNQGPIRYPRRPMEEPRKNTRHHHVEVCRVEAVGAKYLSPGTHERPPSRRR